MCWLTDTMTMPASECKLRTGTRGTQCASIWRHQPLPSNSWPTWRQGEWWVISKSLRGLHEWPSNTLNRGCTHKRLWKVQPKWTSLTIPKTRQREAWPALIINWDLSFRLNRRYSHSECEFFLKSTSFVITSFKTLKRASQHMNCSNCLISSPRSHRRIRSGSRSCRNMNNVGSGPRSNMNGRCGRHTCRSSCGLSSSLRSGKSNLLSIAIAAWKKG